MNILVNCRGWIGDCLFASSLAKKLKEKYPESKITYLIPLVQPKLLLRMNPYIDDVILALTNRPGVQYDLVIQIPEVDQRYPATIYFQAMAGIEDQSTEFDVYTVPEYDVDAGEYLFGIEDLAIVRGKSPNARLVAIQNNWIEKSFLFTKEEYERAIDVPYLGYGGKLRDIGTIRAILDECSEIILVNVGMQEGIPQHHPDAANTDSYAYTASVIKLCDWFIGSEGGLSNLACAIETKCIITTDYIHQLYGPKGVIKQIDSPAMGPCTYYPEGGHVHLDPFLTDEQVAKQIIEIITC